MRDVCGLVCGLWGQKVLKSDAYPPVAACLLSIDLRVYRLNSIKM
jgi:hypothetical protein